jgi:hypothetical protein
MTQIIKALYSIITTYSSSDPGPDFVIAAKVFYQLMNSELAFALQSIIAAFPATSQVVLGDNELA